MGTLIQDVRYGLRTMLRSPGLTVVALLSLALGIGANTAIFSLLNAVLLRPLPVKEPGRLVLLGQGKWLGIIDEFPNRSWDLFSYPFYRELQQRNQVFSGLAAINSMHNDVRATVGESTSSERVAVRLVSGSYFSTLGVNPFVGRTLTDADDQTPGNHPVAVASYAWWSRRLGVDSSVVGKKITIGSTVFTIVGVTPPEFFGTEVGESPDLWIPLAMMAQVPPGWKGLDDRFFQSLYVVARLRRGINPEQAEADVNLIFKQTLQSYAGPQPTQKQLDDIGHAQIPLTAAGRGLSQLRIRFSVPLRILMAVVGLVLLIACANIANLLLARGTARSREIAVRMAMGAGRLRLIRQLLTESLLLAVTGAALGVAFASWASRVLLAMVSTGPEIVPVNVAPDGRVLAFAALLAILTALLFGIVPALRATRLELTPALKEGRGAVSAQVRSPLAKALIVSQVALSLVLLVGAGLFLRSLVKLENVDTGFNKKSVLVFDLDTASIGYKEDARLAMLFQQIEQRVSALPGVTSASFSMLTFNQGEWTQPISIEGMVIPERDRSINQNLVGPGFFATMGLPVLAGRNFGPQDTEKSPKVAVINETMARRFFPNQSPLGRRFMMAGPKPSNYEIIGIVKDAKYERLDERPRRVAFYLYSQDPSYLSNFEVRISGDPAAIVPQIRRTISDINGNLAVSNVTTLAEQVDRSVAPQTLIAQLSSFFGLLAVFLACLGIYGLMSYAVSRRTNEIGIRLALGAARSNVLWLVMREVLVLAVAGLAIGVPVALASTRLVSSMLFGLTATDPVSMISAVALMLGVAAVSGYLPARRATKVDPTVALRYE